MKISKYDPSKVMAMEVEEHHESGYLVPSNIGKEYVTIFISWNAGKPADNFRCRRCGRRLFVFGGGQVYAGIDVIVVKFDLYLDIPCPNKNCGLIYRVYSKG